jgi:hypothetical protein
MPSPETDYYAWLMETAELVDHGRWEDVDLEGLGAELRGLARGQVRTLRQAIARWLEAGARRDRDAAAREMATIRDLLTRSPSLAAYEPLRQRVHGAWRDVGQRLRQEGAPVPKVSYHELDRAAGKIRLKLGGVID